MAPEYCQSVLPLYCLAASTCAVSLYYFRQSVKTLPKTFSQLYGSGAVIFFVVGLGICIRAVNIKTRSLVEVDEIYGDVFAHSKDMTKLEKTRLSALFSQAKYGDAPASMYSYVSTVTKALTGFSYGQAAADNSSNWKLWSEMRGTPQRNATRQLVDYTCTVFDRLRDTQKKQLTTFMSL